MKKYNPRTNFALALFSLLLLMTPAMGSDFQDEKLEREVSNSHPSVLSKALTQMATPKNDKRDEQKAFLKTNHTVRGVAALSFYMVDALEDAGMPQIHRVRYALLGALSLYELYALYSGPFAIGGYEDDLAEAGLVSLAFGPALACGEWAMIYGNSLPYPPTLAPDAKAFMRSIPVLVPAAFSLISHIYAS